MVRWRRGFSGACLVWAVTVLAHAQEADPPDEDVAPVMTAPRLVEAPAVELPPDTEPIGDDAGVTLEILIDAEGHVAEVEVVTPLRDDIDALVVEAARRMRFEPARRGETPVAARVRFRFRVRGPSPALVPDPDPPPDPSPPPPPDPLLEDPSLPELGVTAVVDRPEEGAAERITLRAEELTTVPGTFGEPLRVVATLPGVVRSPFGLGFFLVRGANFQNTGFFVDGFPVPLLYHFGAGPAVISSRLVDRLHFYPGGYPVSFGRYTAGVIALETAPPPANIVRAEIEIDLFRAGAFATVSLPDGLGSIAGAVRRSYYDFLLPLFVDGIRIGFTDYQLRSDLRIDRHLSVSIFFFGSDDFLDQSGALMGGTASAGARNRINTDFQRLITRLKLGLDGGGRLTISGMLGRDGNTFTSAQPGRADLQFGQDLFVGGLRIDAFVPWTENLRTRFGFDVLANLSRLDITVPNPPGLGEQPRPAFDPQLTNIRRTLVQETAAFYLEQVFAFDPIQLSVGGRFDLMRYAAFTEIVPDPRGVLRWRVVPELTLKAATGLFSQPPSPFQANPDNGDTQLPPERSFQTSGGVELTLPESIEIHATGYYTYFYQLARQIDELVVDDDGSIRRLIVAGDGEGRAYGFELLIRRRVHRGLYGWLSYTLSRSERFEPDGSVVPFQYDQTHVLNLAVSYRLGGWRFGARFQLATGAMTQRIIGGAWDADQDRYAPIQRGLIDRLPTYHRLDVRIDRDIQLGPFSGSIFLDIQNVYNASNQEGILYQYDYRAQASLPGLPFLPTLGIRLYFEPGVSDAPPEDDEQEDEEDDQTPDEEEQGDEAES